MIDEELRTNTGTNPVPVLGQGSTMYLVAYTKDSKLAARMLPSRSVQGSLVFANSKP